MIRSKKRKYEFSLQKNYDFVFVLLKFSYFLFEWKRQHIVNDFGASECVCVNVLLCIKLRTKFCFEKQFIVPLKVKWVSANNPQTYCTSMFYHFFCFFSYFCFGNNRNSDIFRSLYLFDFGNFSFGTGFYFFHICLLLYSVSEGTLLLTIKTKTKALRECLRFFPSSFGFYIAFDDWTAFAIIFRFLLFWK